MKSVQSRTSLQLHGIKGQLCSNQLMNGIRIPTDYFEAWIGGTDSENPTRPQSEWKEGIMGTAIDYPTHCFIVLCV